MKNWLPILIVFILSSCKNFEFKKDNVRIKALNDMQQTDVDFSAFSKEHGFRKAFTEYIDEDGVLLRPNHMPIVGADAIEYISNFNDSTIELTWEPEGADISQGGDMGYTYGIYTMKNGSEVTKGTYVTVWRKQKDGKWKFVVDAGNQGLGEETPAEQKPEE